MTRARGVTLVEVMIAVGITAVIGVMVMGAFQRTYAARDLTEAQDERFSSARVTLTRLARELSEAFLSEHYDHKRSREPLTRFRGKDGGERDDLLFATMSHTRLVRDAKESDQAVVEYTLESDPDHSGERALFRREKVRIDEEIDRGGRKDLVADHLTSLRLQYWDPRKNDWVREWSTRSVDHPGDLPTRVKFELELKLADGRIEKLSTEARIALTRSLNF